jgi:hypothetical protein
MTATPCATPLVLPFAAADGDGIPRFGTVTVTGLRRLPMIALVGVPDPKAARDLIDLAFAGARLRRPRWRLVVEVDVPGADERTVARMATGVHAAVAMGLMVYAARCDLFVE